MGTSRSHLQAGARPLSAIDAWRRAAVDDLPPYDAAYGRVECQKTWSCKITTLRREQKAAQRWSSSVRAACRARTICGRSSI